MNSSDVTFTLSFEGNAADKHEIDFYDVAEALKGFQRSLAITTHLVLNGEVIVQAPSLKLAKIYAVPPKKGSWELTAIIVGAGIAAGSASKDSLIGNLIYSAYSYVMSKTLGFEVDYDKTIGQQYLEAKKHKELKVPYLDQTRFDSAVEKCVFAIQEMHRPMVKSITATQAKVSVNIDGEKVAISHVMNSETYQYIVETIADDQSVEELGRVSGYNSNTFKGRMYIEEYNRPIPFELLETAKSSRDVDVIVNSLREHAKAPKGSTGQIKIVCYKNFTRAGVLKNILVLRVSKDEEE